MMDTNKKLKLKIINSIENDLKVNDLLKLLKANRYTYYNLFDYDIQRFKSFYNYLKRNKDYEIKKDSYINFLIRCDLKDNRLITDYCLKLKIMQTITYNL